MHARSGTLFDFGPCLCGDCIPTREESTMAGIPIPDDELELRAMRDIAKIMKDVEDAPTRRRVARWVAERFDVEPAPTTAAS